METWDREGLYAEIWEQPLVKLAPKYGISAVALGKVCRKLQIPLPGRGCWVKKEFGKPVKRLPLPVAKNLPVVQRMKFPPAQGISNPQTASPAPEPTDPEFLRIVELESRTILVDPNAKRHKLVIATERVLSHARPDEKGRRLDFAGVCSSPDPNRTPPLNSDEVGHGGKVLPASKMGL
jgi:hypothetical protein